MSVALERVRPKRALEEDLDEKLFPPKMFLVNSVPAMPCVRNACATLQTASDHMKGCEA